MIIISLVAVAALNVVAMIAVALFVRRSLSVLHVESFAPGPSLYGRSVVVSTRRPDDQSIRGVLVAQHSDRVTLREAIYLPGDKAIDGLVHVPVANVAFVQEITA